MASSLPTGASDWAFLGARAWQSKSLGMGFSGKRARFGSAGAQTMRDAATETMDDAADGNIMSTYNLTDFRYRTRKERYQHKKRRLRSERHAQYILNLEVKPSKFLYHGENTITHAVNQQSIFGARALCSAYGVDFLEDDLHNILLSMPMLNATGANWPIGSNFDNRFKVLWCQQEVELHNLEIVGLLYVDVYTCVSTRSGDQTSIGGLLAGTTTAWAGQSGLTSNNVGAVPTDFKVFVDNAKVLKKQTFVLLAGQHIKYNWNGAKNFFYDGAFENARVAHSEFAIPGRTMFQLFAVRQGTTAAISGVPALTIGLRIYTTNRYSVKPVLRSGGLVETTQFGADM